MTDTATEEHQPIRVATSSCLLGEEVRFNGGHKHNGYLTKTLARYFELIPFCPEVAIGYFSEDIHTSQRAAVLKLFALATEPARNEGSFDFCSSDLAVRIRDAGMALSFDEGYWHTPSRRCRISAPQTGWAIPSRRTPACKHRGARHTGKAP